MNAARPAPASGLIVAPGQHAADAHELVDLAKQILERAVIAERAAGTPWQAIGAAAGGVGRPTAHGRFSAAVQAFQGRVGDVRQPAADAELDEAWGRVSALAERRARRDEILAAAVAMESSI